MDDRQSIQPDRTGVGAHTPPTPAGAGDQGQLQPTLIDPAGGMIDPSSDPHLTSVPDASALSAGNVLTTDQEFPADEHAGIGENQTLAEPISASAREPSAEPPIGMLAGYELLEVLGRGGMGIVYKARQPKLNRLVALKMILAGAHAGSQQLARFQTEARAVASLQHPNIVQIHEVGEADGQQFISLEFVDGEPLDRKLAGKPQDPRESARLVSVLARAMQVAHEQGIVHRDLKPANVLIQKAGSVGHATSQRRRGEALGATLIRKATTIDPRTPLMGIPKITDFGLAKRMEEQDSNTVTGAIMGTPSYMAPEQATGKTHDIGPLADVYALGAILYESLTGRPPFAGVTALETLKQVQSQDPVAPTRLQPRLPRDLETICLKALQKEPRRRYQSAAELADDLDRYLDGEPILARPVSLWVHGVKWARRRPALASLIGVTAVASLAVVSVILWSNAELRLSNRRLEAARERAAFNYERARKAVDELLRAVSDELEDAPQMEGTRRTLLEKALAFYQDFLKEKSADPTIRLELARTCAQVGDIYRLLGEHERGQHYYREMFRMAEELPAAARDTAAFQADLGSASRGLALSLKATNNLAEALSASRKGLEAAQRAAVLGGSDRRHQQDLSQAHYVLGVILAASPAELSQAELAYRESLRIQRELLSSSSSPRERRELARLLNNLGLLLTRTRRPADAQAAFLEARSIQRELVAQPQARPIYRRELARTHNNLAVLMQADPRRIGEAEEHYAEVQRLLEGLVRDFPGIPDYRNELGMCYANQAMLHRGLRRLDQSLQKLDDALRIQRVLVEEFPAVADYRQRLGRTLISLGHCQRDRRQALAAEAAYREAIAIHERLLHDARGPEYLSGSAVARFALARVLGEQPLLIPLGDDRLAVASSIAAALNSLERLVHLQTAVAHQEEALRLNSANAAYRTDLANYHLALAQAELSLGMHAAAAKSARRLTEVLPEDQLQAFRAAYWLARCLAVAEDDPQLSPEAKAECTEEYAAEAVRFLRRAFNLGYRDLPALRRAPFDVLQPRPDFKRLMEEMNEKSSRVITRR